MGMWEKSSPEQHRVDMWRTGWANLQVSLNMVKQRYLIFMRLSHVHMAQLKGDLPIYLTHACFLIIELHFSPRQLKLFRLLKASLVESLLAL